MRAAVTSRARSLAPLVNVLMNPYNRLPVLVERDLVLYESNIINEYIDERFPHPQLMPADPVMRARARLMLYNMEAELFSQIEALDSGKEKQVEKARQQVTDRLIELSPVFTKTKHMLGDDFTMLDVAVAPLLWRLDHYGIKLGKPAAPLSSISRSVTCWRALSTCFSLPESSASIWLKSSTSML